ncbi:MAG TPA: biotin transporter BioY [Terriglobales bacterium]|nr:biotin transporter BioY [Terriglobales bacterium]
MARTAAQVLDTQNSTLDWARQVAIVVGATLFIAICARITVPLPFTPVPLTLQDFAVLLVGLALGARRGFAALVLYLAEGASGMPVFNPLGPGGIAQLLGPTGGFLLVYPFVAALAGWILSTGKSTFARAAMASLLAEIVLFAGGISWLAVLTHSVTRALQAGLYPFIPGAIIKIMFAAGIASGSKWIYNTRIRKALP